MGHVISDVSKLAAFPPLVLHRRKVDIITEGSLLLIKCINHEQAKRPYRAVNKTMEKEKK